MLSQFGVSKFTTVHWTVIYLDRLIGRHQTVHLVLDGKVTYIWTIQVHISELSKWTVHIHVFQWSKYMYLDGLNTLCQGVHLDV